ncbi:septum formation initiator family protein [Actinophytocola sp. NPDC049390]|uniref:septum formation initiator family protein n=1 Tax=Actinophytocola sp. NPDC049390 TaxID=3363894 RepID=UPI00379BD205
MADEPGRDTERRRTAGGRRPQSVRRPRDGRPARPVSPGRTARSRTVRAAATFGLSTTRRAAVFAIVFCALALSVAVPLRTYLGQRDDVARQEQLQAELRAEVDALEARKAELDDPAQVEAEARRRLRYVMPGETPYIVELPEGQAEGSQEPDKNKVNEASWYQLLWNAVSGE